MNGETPELPTIIVEFHPGAQAVGVKAKGFANPRMVKAVLQMAVDEIDSQIRLQMALAMQQQAQEQEKANQIARSLRNGN